MAFQKNFKEIELAIFIAIGPKKKDTNILTYIAMYTAHMCTHAHTYMHTIMRYTKTYMDILQKLKGTMMCKSCHAHMQTHTNELNSKHI